jgi:hypothetical protein
LSLTVREASLEWRSINCVARTVDSAFLVSSFFFVVNFSLFLISLYSFFFFSSYSSAVYFSFILFPISLLVFFLSYWNYFFFFLLSMSYFMFYFFDPCFPIHWFSASLPLILPSVSSDIPSISHISGFHSLYLADLR